LKCRETTDKHIEKQHEEFWSEVWKRGNSVVGKKQFLFGVKQQLFQQWIGKNNVKFCDAPSPLKCDIRPLIVVWKLFSFSSGGIVAQCGLGTHCFRLLISNAGCRYDNSS